MKYVIEMACFPPGINIVIAVMGLALWRRWRRAAALLLLSDVVLLYILSLPMTELALMSTLQPYPPLNLQRLNGDQAQAIVVLGAGRYADALEYGGDTVSRFELERLRYAAHLYRASRLPIMLAGGGTESEAGRIPESLLMKKTALEDFGVPVMWTEEHSRTTAENAANAAALLREHGIHRVYLVTHAWHMPRSAAVFRRAGFEVIEAPTAYTTRYRTDLLTFLPRAESLRDSNIFIHEVIGLLWYRLKLAF